jgi:hypothetical protein
MSSSWMNNESPPQLYQVIGLRINLARDLTNQVSKFWEKQNQKSEHKKKTTTLEIQVLAIVDSHLLSDSLHINCLDHDSPRLIY